MGIPACIAAPQGPPHSFPDEGATKPNKRWLSALRRIQRKWRMARGWEGVASRMIRQGSINPAHTIMRTCTLDFLEVLYCGVFSQKQQGQQQQQHKAWAAASPVTAGVSSLLIAVLLTQEVAAFPGHNQHLFLSFLTQHVTQRGKKMYPNILDNYPNCFLKQKHPKKTLCRFLFVVGRKHDRLSAWAANVVYQLMKAFNHLSFP